MATFDVNAVIPPNSQAGQALAQATADVSTAQATYDQVSQYSAALTSKGPAHDAVILKGFAAGFNVIVPGAGDALMSVYNAAPHAGSGPGYCISDPPVDFLPATLKAWPHYNSWEKSYGSYAPPAPDTFEAFAYPIIRRNIELGDNCYGGALPNGDVLLAALLKTWNATHGPPMRTISYSGLNPGGWGTGPSDPIGATLNGIASVGVPGSSPWGTDTSTHNQTISFQVGTTHKIVLHLPSNLGGSTSSATTSGKIVKWGLLSVGGAALAGAAYGQIAKKDASYVFKKAWTSAKSEGSAGYRRVRRLV